MAYPDPAFRKSIPYTNMRRFLADSIGEPMTTLQNHKPHDRDQAHQQPLILSLFLAISGVSLLATITVLVAEIYVH